MGCAGNHPDGGPLQDAGPPPDGGIAFWDGSFLDASADAGGPGTDAGSDAGPVSCGGACDPADPLGSCAMDACLLTAADPACMPVTGALPAGAPCTDVSACAAGLACFKSASGGICRAVCCPGGVDVCTADERCGGLGVLVDDSATAYRACLPRRGCLDPFESTDCDVGEACYFTSSEGYTDCREEGAALEGESCTLPEDCAGGLSCLGAITASCRRVCDDLADCDPGQVCVSAYFPDPFFAGVGHCL